MSQITKYAVRGLILLGFIAAMAACSSPNASSIVNPETGKHSATWIVDHRTAALTNQTVCAECHGSDLKGGISGVSCFSASFNGMTCHANGPSGHPAGWANPASHGAAAKSAPNPAATQGFSTCQACHGSDFSGGISTIVCSSCHGGAAPHPVSWATGTGTYTHTNTDTGNAPVCALCHAGGNLSPIAPPPTPAPGTPIGCFNNTLCHAVPGHAAGWSDPTVHGASAKAAPNAAAMQGFSTCQTCHGSDFSGGISTIVCSSCHGGAAPHPVSWITGTYTHTNTDQGNAPVCALCHTNGANSPIAPPSPAAPAGTAPGCFNATLCHATPTAACGTCHAIPPNGTVSPNVAGQHAIHTGLGSSITCDTCHTGGGFGTANHGNGTVVVSIAPAYNAKAGPASYNASTLSCSDVACHGGVTTPNWQTGTIDVNTQCASCHVLGTAAGIPENNSYFSGRHTGTSMSGFPCTTCHDTTKLALVHFTSLTAPISEATAATTIKSAINFNGTTCNPSAGGLTGCHGSLSW
jgi:predicted CxxxxCH...CXXCH cytochrome family protein